MRRSFTILLVIVAFAASGCFGGDASPGVGGIDGGTSDLDSGSRDTDGGSTNQGDAGSNDGGSPNEVANVLATLYFDFWTFVPVGDKVFFVATNADTEDARTTLWVTDGTQAGTREVSPSVLWSVPPLQAYTYPPFDTAPPVVNGKIIFTAADENYVSHTYASAGTADTTVLLTDVTFSSAIALVGTKLYFRGLDADEKFGLYVTDGTPAGTKLVRADPNEFQALSEIKGTGWNDKLYFFQRGDKTGLEVWSSDGTEAGTTLLAKGNGYLDSTMAVFKDKLYFGFHDLNDADTELWVSDGTPGGTTQFANLHPTSTSSPSGFQVLGDRLIFLAYGPGNPGNAPTLWATDGTVPGTVELTQAMHKPVEYTLPEVNGKLLYSAFIPSTSAVELWASDGTPAGTTKLGDVHMFSERQVTKLGTSQAVFFGTTEVSNVGEPWITDGTPGGTKQLVELGTSGEGSIPFKNGHPAMASLGDKAYFLAQPSSKLELYETDGTAAGTKPLLPANTSIGMAPVPVGDVLLTVLSLPVSSSLEKTKSLLYAHEPGTAIDIGDLGESVSGECESQCPSETSDVQLDSFCRLACCHQVTGDEQARQDTCAAGASLGTSSCNACN